jgi:hypothetical protein
MRWRASISIAPAIHHRGRLFRAPCACAGATQIDPCPGRSWRTVRLRDPHPGSSVARRVSGENPALRAGSRVLRRPCQRLRGRGDGRGGMARSRAIPPRQNQRLDSRRPKHSGSADWSAAHLRMVAANTAHNHADGSGCGTQLDIAEAEATLSRWSSGCCAIGRVAPERRAQPLGFFGIQPNLARERAPARTSPRLRTTTLMRPPTNRRQRRHCRYAHRREQFVGSPEVACVTAGILWDSAESRPRTGA